jgi:hypothetical protein
MLWRKNMRDVYPILQKLRDQEKRERSLLYAEAEGIRIQKEEDVREGYRRLEEERQVRVESMGMRVVQDYLNMQRHINIQKTEKELQEAAVHAENCRQEMVEAQVESKVMERVIETLEEKEQKRYKRQVSRFNDEIAIMGWGRRQ